MEEINLSNYQIVLGENDNFITNENQILVQRVSDGSLLFLDSDLALRNLGSNVHGEEASYSPTNTAHTIVQVAGDSNGKQIRTTWTREEIIELINQYKEHKKAFKSSTVKNDKVWHDISTIIRTHTWEKCKNKFKYLKGKYMEKKDNMGSKASGSKAIKFDFFEEFDEIFREEPNVTPVAIASSSRGEKNLETIQLPKNEENNLKRKGEEENVKNTKKVKKHIDVNMEIAQMKENGRNERHREKMEVLRELNSVLRDLANCLKKDD